MFQYKSKADKHLTVVLAHEFVLCQENFNLFTHYASLQILGDLKKETAIKLYSCYTQFLHHLYEFYMGIIKRKMKGKIQLSWQVTDAILVEEVKKLFKSRVQAIKAGHGHPFENDVSHYEIMPPSNFGEVFRKIRNRTAHASIKRAKDDLTLTEFYKNYHRFIYILYETAMFSWDVYDIEIFDWEDIENFSINVKNERLL